MNQPQSVKGPAKQTREKRIQLLKSKSHYPVVIIGAGINGLGVYHDLCHQGVDCLIVDKGDFCSGTSAAPSRMVHGGLKYLETGEFRLVKESVHERNSLLKNAPHLVRPLEMLIPIETMFGGEIVSVMRFFGGKEVMKKRGRTIIKAGLATYDFFSKKNRVAPNHRMISNWELHSSLPGISNDFKYAASYFDAQVPMAERLGLELAQDGMAANPQSLALNYCSLNAVSDGQLVLRDELTQLNHSISADVVINAAGPWIDEANVLAGKPTQLISGTKGAHILLDLPVLRDSLAGRMIYFDPGDGRICLVMPLAGKVLLGSTDIPANNPDTAICDDNEIDYMLGALRTVFPKLNVNRNHIVFTYSGIRPLPTSDASNPGEISRDHSINVIESESGRPFPILSLVGGKWTTYRAFGEEVSNIVLQRLGLSRKMGTENVMIGGGRGLSADVDTWEKLIDKLTDMLHGNRARAGILAERYGSRAEDVIAYCSKEDPMVAGLFDVSAGEIAFMVEVEMCEHVADIVLRRLPLAFGGKLTLPVTEAVVDVMASINGWSPSEKQEQISELEEIMLTRHRIDIKTGRFKEA